MSHKLPAEHVHVKQKVASCADCHEAVHAQDEPIDTGEGGKERDQGVQEAGVPEREVAFGHVVQHQF